MSSYVCFTIEPSKTERRKLRRYRSSALSTCPGPMGYHDASTPIDDAPATVDHAGIHLAPGNAEPPRDDPRWPRACSCGYLFAADDEWQLFTELLWVRPGTGETFTLRDAPIGAMWRADWMEPHWQGPDGICLTVQTPAGDWCIDGPSKDGGRWTRTGVAPAITVSPSILIGSPTRYHGYLRAGLLESTPDSPT